MHSHAAYQSKLAEAKKVSEIANRDMSKVEHEYKFPERMQKITGFASELLDLGKELVTASKTLVQNFGNVPVMAPIVSSRNSAFVALSDKIIQEGAKGGLLNIPQNVQEINAILEKADDDLTAIETAFSEEEGVDQDLIKALTQNSKEIMEKLEKRAQEIEESRKRVVAAKDALVETTQDQMTAIHNLTGFVKLASDMLVETLKDKIEKLNHAKAQAVGYLNYIARAGKLPKAGEGDTPSAASPSSVTLEREGSPEGSPVKRGPVVVDIDINSRRSSGSGEGDSPLSSPTHSVYMMSPASSSHSTPASATRSPMPISSPASDSRAMSPMRLSSKGGSLEGSPVRPPRVVNPNREGEREGEADVLESKVVKATLDFSKLNVNAKPNAAIPFGVSKSGLLGSQARAGANKQPQAASGGIRNGAVSPSRHQGRV